MGTLRIRSIVQFDPYSWEPISRPSGDGRTLQFKYNAATTVPSTSARTIKYLVRLAKKSHLQFPPGDVLTDMVTH